MAENMFTPENDVTEERNGVNFLVAPKGIPIPMERAKALGLVKEAAPTGPLETKADQDSAPPQINPDDLATVQGATVEPGDLATVQGATVEPGDLAADLEKPSTIKKATK